MRVIERWSQSAHFAVRASMGGLMVSVRRDRTFVEWLTRKRITDRVTWWCSGDGRWFHYPSFELIEDDVLVQQLEKVIRADCMGS